MTLFTLCDMAEAWQYKFQDAATPIMEGIINFHNDLMFYLVVIIGFVLWILLRCIHFFAADHHPVAQRWVHGTTVEILWTSFPALVLFLIALPSFALLYSMDELVDPVLTLKVVGHQWYWSYEYSDATTLEPVTFESYMVQEENLEIGQLRLLEVDHRVVVPVNTHIRVLLTASDVLHSWAVPSFGLKLDACPGRLNQTSLFVKRAGVFYGQCSEICGINHGFMPIVVESVPVTDYFLWLSQN